VADDQARPLRDECGVAAAVSRSRGRRIVAGGILPGVADERGPEHLDHVMVVRSRVLMTGRSPLTTHPTARSVRVGACPAQRYCWTRVQLHSGSIALSRRRCRHPGRAATARDELEADKWQRRRTNTFCSSSVIRGRPRHCDHGTRFRQLDKAAGSGDVQGLIDVFERSNRSSVLEAGGSVVNIPNRADGLSKLDMPVFGPEHVARYEATDGQWGHIWNGYPCLVLYTTGRKSGMRRKTAMLYGRRDSDLVVIASNGGARRHPAWYLNLRSEPRVSVRVGDQVTDRIARTAHGEERSRLWDMMTKIWPDFDAYAERARAAHREIPVVVLELPRPTATNDAEADPDERHAS
jgi:deazaflavin-dependent oxidoreductase (nitroreductase family)